jgi:hypothetical protein
MEANYDKIPDTQNTVAPHWMRGLAAFEALTKNALPILAGGKAKPRIKCGATISGGRIRQQGGHLGVKQHVLKADLEFSGHSTFLIFDPTHIHTGHSVRSLSASEVWPLLSVP